jgi:hypothetical protein
MNLPPEELQFFRAQRMTASTEAIAFNFNLCGQLLNAITAAQQPGPALLHKYISLKQVRNGVRVLA